jgi:hypothetical protein
MTGQRSSSIRPFPWNAIMREIAARDMGDEAR